MQLDQETDMFIHTLICTSCQSIQPYLHYINLIKYFLQGVTFNKHDSIF